MNKSSFTVQSTVANRARPIFIFQSLYSFRLLAALTLGVLKPASLLARETWQDALAGMPLHTDAKVLNRTNCVETMLKAFTSNDVVKALVFMPGATDEFYLLRRAKAVLTKRNPTLLDAVAALTNQTFIRAKFSAPFLLLNTDADPDLTDNQIRDHPTAERLNNKIRVGCLACNDRDWDFLQPILKRALKIGLRPWQHSPDSWHFYRHSFAAWNVTGLQTLELVSLAGKSKFVLQRNQARFQVDRRFGKSGSVGHPG
jgi:hypothetical protein